MMLQHDEALDLVIGTGESHTVREFLEEAFGYVGLDYQEYVRIDENYYRPTEVDYLLSEPTMAKKLLGWKPRVGFHELVRIMVDADLELEGLEAPGEGKQIVDERFGEWHDWDHQVVSMGR